MGYFEKRRRMKAPIQSSTFDGLAGMSTAERLVDRILCCGGELEVAFEAGKALFLATPGNPSARVGPDFFERPWKWLAAVAEAAESEEHWLVGAKIALMCHLWNHSLLKHDFRLEIGSLVPTPPEVEAQIYEAGIGCLRRLPPESRLGGDAQGEFIVRDTQLRVASQLLQLAQDGTPIAAETRVIAESMLDSQGSRQDGIFRIDDKPR